MLSVIAEQKWRTLQPCLKRGHRACAIEQGANAVARSEQVRESYALAMPLGVKGTLAILILHCVLQQGETVARLAKDICCNALLHCGQGG